MYSRQNIQSVVMGSSTSFLLIGVELIYTELKNTQIHGRLCFVLFSCCCFFVWFVCLFPAPFKIFFHWFLCVFLLVVVAFGGDYLVFCCCYYCCFVLFLLLRLKQLKYIFACCRNIARNFIFLCYLSSFRLLLSFFVFIFVNPLGTSCDV